MKARLSQLGIWSAVGFMGICTFIPFVIMLVMSVKTQMDVYTNFWGLPYQPAWDNYGQATAIIGNSIWVSLFVACGSAVGTVVLSSMAGYVFARHKFPGRDFLFYFFLAMLMVPALLTLVPSFFLVHSLGIYDTYWSLFLPYIAGGQVFGMLLCRSFLCTLPEDLFEAARIDGASELSTYWSIALPLSLPILATVAINQFLSAYNDYVWPLIAIADNLKRTFAVAVVLNTDPQHIQYGINLACDVLGAIPLLILMVFGMRYFVAGLLQGAIRT